MSNRYSAIALAAAISAGGGGGYWLASKLPLLLDLQGTHVGSDVIVIAYVTFALGVVFAAVAALCAGGNARLSILSRCATVINVTFLLIWMALHLTGKVCSHEDMLGGV